MNVCQCYTILPPPVTHKYTHICDTASHLWLQVLYHCVCVSLVPMRVGPGNEATCVCACVCACVYMYMCVCVHVCVHCICVCECVGVWVCVCVYLCTRGSPTTSHFRWIDDSCFVMDPHSGSIPSSLSFLFIRSAQLTGHQCNYEFCNKISGPEKKSSLPKTGQTQRRNQTAVVSEPLRVSPASFYTSLLYLSLVGFVVYSCAAIPVFMTQLWHITQYS